MIARAIVDVVIKELDATRTGGACRKAGEFAEGSVKVA